MVPYTAIAGAGLSIAGGVLGAQAANKRREELRKIVNLPGIELGGTTAESLQAIQGNLGLAGDVTGRMADIDQATLDRLLEQSMPGYEARQAAQGNLIDSYLRGEIPVDVQNAIYRSGAARSLGSGFGMGSGMGRNLVARDLGLTSLDLQRMGLGAAGEFARTTKAVGLTTPTPVAAYAGLTPTQAVELRSRERTERIEAMLNRALAPRGSEVTGRMLSNLGSSLMGSGGMRLGGLFGGGGGGGGGTAAGPHTSFALQEG
jgi:hypothetical protein